jgi:pilus assembly protein CpaE
MTALLISEDPDLQRQIALLCAARTPVLKLACARQAGAGAAHGAAPRLLLLDARCAERDAAVFERLSGQFPGASWVLLAKAPTQDLLLQAMRAGVREVLALPVTAGAFEAALGRLLRKPQAAGNGKVLAFVSCKGGSGATFIAANLGYALAEPGKRKVLLIDLNQQFGDAALYVTDQKPAMTLADLCEQIGRVDAAFLDASLLKVTPRYGILAAGEDADGAGRVRPDQVEAILRLARRHYDLVLLDIGRRIDTVSIRALDNADLIYPVLQLALPDIRDGCRPLDIFRSLGYRREHIRLIVNRYEKGGRLRLTDLESALGAEVLHTVPNDYVAVTDSVNQGVPLLRQAYSSAAARSLLRLAGQILDTPPADGRGGLVRMLGKIFS